MELPTKIDSGELFKPYKTLDYSYIQLLYDEMVRILEEFGAHLLFLIRKVDGNRFIFNSFD